MRVSHIDPERLRPVRLGQGPQMNLRHHGLFVRVLTDTFPMQAGNHPCSIHIG
jgi:hypothetical protein